MASVLQVSRLKRNISHISLSDPERSGASAHWPDAERMPEKRLPEKRLGAPIYHPRWAIMQLCIALALWAAVIVGINLVTASL